LTDLDLTVGFATNTVNPTPQVLVPDVTFTDTDGNFDGGQLKVSGLLIEDTGSIPHVSFKLSEIGLDATNMS
jgi:hypothetical protein